MDRTYWLCSRNRYQKCKARLITKASTREVFIKNQEHNHQPDAEFEVVPDDQILYFDDIISPLNECTSNFKDNKE